MKLSLGSAAGGLAELDVQRTSEGFEIAREGHRKTARVLDESGSRLVFELDGVVHRAHVFVRAGSVHVVLRGRETVFRSKDASTSLGSAGAVVDPILRASLPGRVLKILAPPGTAVRIGDPILLIEAMKMENPVLAEADGTVAEIHVEAGEMVQVGQPLATCDYGGPSERAG